jgi:hypothetical protein
LIEVIYDNVSHKFEDLDQAMAWAKELGKFVTIRVNGMELVGMFGADSIVDGMCPDGIEYSWKKRRP